MHILRNVPGVIRIRENNMRGCIMMDYAKYGNLL
jgi:BR serine/threonine kinase